jgi:hypothetical protein
LSIGYVGRNRDGSVVIGFSLVVVADVCFIGRIVGFVSVGGFLGSRLDIMVSSLDQQSLATEDRRCGTMEVKELATAHEAVMGRWVVLGEVIGQVVGPAAPMDNNLVLAYPVTDPVKAHVDGFGAALLDSAIGDAISAGVISLHGGGWLGWPMSARVVRNQAASLPLWKRAPDSASAAEETTTLRMVQGTW